MDGIIKYRFEGRDDPLVLSEAIKSGCNLSKKSLVNYILTNNTNAVFPVVNARSVVPVYPQETYEHYKDRIRAESSENIEKIFHDLLIENIEASGKFTKKALLLSGGIDSILVAGILARQYGSQNVRFYHMRHGHFTKGETERAREVAKTLGIKLIEINKGPFTPEDYLEPIQINGHSVDLSAPSYLEACRQIEKEQGSDVDVFNGELNLIDVGFSESSDPTRALRRFIFRHMQHFSMVAPLGWDSIPLIPGTNKYVSVLNEIASMLFKRSSKRQFIAGFYTGKAHFPGFHSWEYKCNINHQVEIDRLLDQIGYRYNSDFKEFLYKTAPAMYSGTTNVETIGSLIECIGMNYVMPYSSPSLAALSVSLPRDLSDDKAIQKRMAVGQYGINEDVAFYLKCHAGFNASYSSHFDRDSFREFFDTESSREKHKILDSSLYDLRVLPEYDVLRKSGITDQLSLRTFIAMQAFSQVDYI